VNRGADFVKHLVPSRRARQNKALDPTALLGASVCKHPASPVMLAGQRRDSISQLEWMSNMQHCKKICLHA
jgi:hypothetical protein